ncbi:MAG: NUDIX domain-containing protein [candidate division SR1 bacterium]|nr:NUDIX domain-containing protein [candidate division SR1 bacterium]
MDFNYDEIIDDFSEKLPKFEDGRIDYRGSKKAFVINAFVSYNGKILLLKRSDKVGAYQGKRNSIGGYLDEKVTLEEKIYEELREELGITKEGVKEIRPGKIHKLEDPTINRTRIIYPSIVELEAEPKIQLDREHTEYKRIRPEEIKDFDIVLDLDTTYQYAIA